MIGRRCPALPGGAHGSAWRGGPSATGLPGCRMPRSFLDLPALRPRAALLQRYLPLRSPARAAPPRQRPTPAKPGRKARSSRPATQIPPSPRPRDGSGFPFDLFSGIMRLWDAGNTAGDGSIRFGRRRQTPEPAGEASGPLPLLRRLRTKGPVRRSLPTISAMWKKEHMISPETRVQIRRYFTPSTGKSAPLPANSTFIPTPCATPSNRIVSTARSRGTPRIDRGVHRSPQPPAQTLYLDCQGVGHSRKGQAGKRSVRLIVILADALH